MANATITVLEADGVTQTDVVTLDVGRQAAAASKSLTLSTEDKAVLDSLATKLDTAITALQIIDNMVLSAGTANIGDVDVLTLGGQTPAFGAGATTAATLRVALTSDSSNTNGQATMANSSPIVLPSDQSTLAVASDTSRILNGASGTSLTPKWATIAVSSSGDNSIVALVSGKKIRVLFWDLAPNAAVNAKWRSNTTDKTGLYYMTSQGNGHARGFNPVGWFETASGEALQLNLSGAVAVGGIVGYIEV